MRGTVEAAAAAAACLTSLEYDRAPAASPEHRQLGFPTQTRRHHISSTETHRCRQTDRRTVRRYEMIVDVTQSSAVREHIPQIV